MSIRIDGRFFEQRCDTAPQTLSVSAAASLVETCGWLAPWMLEPAVIEQATSHRPAYQRYLRRPALPADPGGSWIIFVRPAAFPALRPAFVLPFRWQANVEDDPHLPSPLRGLADQIRRQLPGEGDECWGLRLARPEGEEARDLSALDAKAMGESSGWASLVGGLLLARSDGVPDVHVWASAAWHDEYGIGRVAGHSETRTLATHWGARHVYVPAQNQEEVDQWRGAGGRVSVGLLSAVSRSPDPTRLLEEYLDQLGTEPLETESFERRRKFYALVNRRRADAFYWKCLLKDSISRCRGRIRAKHPDCRPTHLVTVVSNQASVVGLAPRALEVGHCLLLHEEPPDKVISGRRDEVLELLKKHDVNPIPVGIHLDERADELRQIEAAIRAFAAGVSAERLAFDLTPGYKFLSLELEELAPIGSWLLYCRLEQLPPDKRVDPGTEDYDCWRHR